jgi:uncharacterized protein (TIGR03435 family)
MKFHVLLGIAYLSSVSLCLSGVNAFPAQRSLTFDVVSVRENRSGVATFGPMSLTPRGVTFMGVTPLRLIEWAHELDPRQVLGGPPWIRDTRFDVQMIAADGTDRSAFREMTKAMLRDRFGLKVSVEMAQRPIYKLQLAHSDRRLGPALKPSSQECNADIVPANKPDPTICNISVLSNDTGIVAMTARRVTIAELARALTRLRYIDRIVLDDTGLAGEYQFSVTPLAGISERGQLLDAGPQLDAGAMGALFFSALRHQLGLTLVSTDGPVTVLQIREIGRPSEN